MLTLAQRSRPPVRFRGVDLLGGASLVVPAGTAVRLPAAPASLTFQGYNTLSAKVTLAGMSGADAFTLAVDTLDPESTSGAALASSLGRTNVIASVGNGDKAGILRLATALSPSGGLLVPTSDITPFGTEWAPVNPIGLNTYTCVDTDDAGTRWIFRELSIVGTYSYVFGIPNCPPAASYAITTTVANTNSQNFAPGLFTFFWTVFDSAGTQYRTPVFDASPYTVGSGWIPLLTTATPNGGALGTPNSFAITGGFGSNPANTSFGCTYMAVGGGAGVNTKAIPFDHNMIVLDATASAHDVTVSALFLELTNA